MKKLIENPTDFESCKNMIYKLALNKWKQECIKRPDVVFDDVYGEACLIYAKCLKEYKGSKGSKFTTYLYQNLLGRLSDYYKCTLKPISHYEDMNEKGNGEDKEVTFESRLESYDYDINNDELFIAARDELSYEGLQVFKFIVSREWENAHAKTQPSTAAICRKFGYTPEIVDSIMGEIKQFWNKIGYAVA